MRILGIDPGYERLGVAVLEKNKGDKKEKVIFSECFKTSSKLDFSERLLLIGDEVNKIIKKYKPEILSIETLFLTTNQKTVMHVAEARGVILYEAIKNDLKIFEASPLQIKMATTGYGKADKNQVIKMTEKYSFCFPDECTYDKRFNKVFHDLRVEVENRKLLILEL
jgi:crossover junction endodeoxyribonuclease RuvC